MGTPKKTKKQLKPRPVVVDDAKEVVNGYTIPRQPGAYHIFHIYSADGQKVNSSCESITDAINKAKGFSPG